MKVELRNITKRFPGVVANENVNLVVEAGEVVALLGENGAGKSTLVNVLFGLYSATEGQVLVNDEVVDNQSPADAIKCGIGMVHQHFMLVPVFSVTENIMLGSEDTGRFGVLDEDAARAKLVEISERFGLEVDPDALIEDLPVGVQQRVEILKALYRDADCLILDEPTAVLTPQEIDDLIEIIRSLKTAGRSIIFISHKLKEVMALADRIVVLRRGKVVGTTTPAETSEQELASMMVGRDVQLVVDKPPAQPRDPVLSIQDLEVLDDRLQRVVDGVSVEVLGGEILAVAGVQGNGQTELVEAISGMRPPAAGTVVLEGEDVTGASPKKLFGMGFAHVPEDRQVDGMIGSFPIKDNLVLNMYGRAPFANGLAVNRKAVEDSARKLVQEFDIRTPSIDTPASSLSGGNQQKLIVAREFSHADRLLVASQPTRGLDVGSIQYIHRRIVEKRDEGVGVLLVSSELDEIMALADRIAVMYRGKIVSVLPREEATRARVGRLMAGVTEAPVTEGTSGPPEGPSDTEGGP